jgi:dienelactone hydrolase
MNRLVLIAIGLLVCCSVAFADPTRPAETRARFHRLIDRPRVALKPETTTEIRDGLLIERGTFQSDSTERVPFVLMRPSTGGRLPVVIVLHGTGGHKEDNVPALRDLAARGLAAIAIDGRFHGARIPGGAHGAREYNEAIIAAWREKDPKRQTHPFYFDTVYDVWRTVDYLQSRADIDPSRIGLIGFSKGGIETWLAAATDERIQVAVPCIAVQSLKWTLESGRWQGRAGTIQAAHEAAAKDMGEPEVNAKVCRALWDKVVPGILNDFDCPNMLRAIAPRPLLIIGGERDPINPVEGARIAVAAAREEYARQGASDRIADDIAVGVAHQVTAVQRGKAYDWLVRWLKEK